MTDLTPHTIRAALDDAWRAQEGLAESEGWSAAVYFEGTEIWNAAAGFADRSNERPFTVDTPVLMWSCTKALSASCVLRAAQENGADLQSRVADFWPEFASGGKEMITLGQLLSHQAGLPALDADHSIFEHEKCAEALARQQPVWEPGTAQGYHARTYGVLAEECVRQLAGKSLRDYFQQYFAAPLELALWIGMPPERTAEAAEIRPPANAPPPPDDRPFYEAMARQDSLTWRAMNRPGGLPSISQMNKPDIRQASIPSLGGIGSARSLAKFYAMLADKGQLAGREFFSSEPLAAATQCWTDREDLVLLKPIAFGAGFMLDPLDQSQEKIRRLFGPEHGAFGQPGFGGGHAFADPVNRLSFAFLPCQMRLGLLPDERACRLVEALYVAAAS